MTAAPCPGGGGGLCSFTRRPTLPGCLLCAWPAWAPPRAGSRAPPSGQPRSAEHLPEWHGGRGGAHVPRAQERASSWPRRVELEVGKVSEVLKGE